MMSHFCSYEARKKFSLLLLICFLAAFVLSPRGARAQQSSVAPQSSPAALNIAGLRDAVTVRRDERGTPYIQASNEADLYFAQGYVTASDRLFQMDLMRRTARGELSEIFGKPTLEEDQLHRRYGFAQVAAAALDKTSPEFRAALESFARGVNAFIESLDEKSLPQEFRILQYKPRLWRAEDSLAIGKLFAETLATSWNIDVMRASLADLPKERRDELLPETSPLDVVIVGSDKPASNKSKPTRRNRSRLPAVSEQMNRAAAELAAVTRRSLERIGLYVEHNAASNNWVVSGKRSITGKPILANDPHLPSSAPSIWYLIHLSAPGLRVAGVTSPGLPCVIIGHNERIVWGLTNLGADAQDLYVEKFSKDDPLLYQTPAGLRKADVRREQINVRKNFAKPDTDTVDYDVTVTRHGPILLEKNGERYALRWTALDPTSIEIEAFYSLNRARNWNQFRAALNRFPGPAQNFVYADVDGHIGYYAAGRIPVRRTGDGSVPYDGAADSGEWTGFIPFDQLPHAFDPPSGILLTANNRIVGLDYPHLITRNWAEPYRARRIYDFLTSKPKLSPADFRALQGDTYSIGAATFAKEVVKTARLHPDSAEWRAMLKHFDGWNALANADSRAMALAGLMRGYFRRRVVEAALGSERAREYRWGNNATFVDYVITDRPAAWLPKAFDSYDALLLACYSDAREELRRQFGEDESQWIWGRLAQVRFPHPLADAPFVGQKFSIAAFGQNGGPGTVNAGAFVSMRLIADTNDWDATQQGIAPGESGDPSSPHWSDQLQSWREVAPPTFPFSEKSVAAATKQSLTLVPVKGS